MAERKTKRNAPRSKRLGDFKLCSEPTVPLVGGTQPHEVSDKTSLPQVYDTPILLAMARDERTIFACWNVAWPSVFQKSVPADRRVYLRVISPDCSERMSVSVEPMLAMHCLTVAGLHGRYRLEIGYYQPADTWHSIATSDEFKMSQGAFETTEVDVATIPFHLKFQQLVNVFEATKDPPLAKAVARFQSSVLNSWPNELPLAARQTLRKLNLSMSEIAAARYDFEKTETAKLAGLRGRLLKFADSSPSRSFDKNAVL